MKRLALIVTHLVALALGFGLGVYALPILIAPEAPSLAAVQQQAATAKYTGQFRRDLKDSDALHWGEGTVSIGAKSIGFAGELAPGPDYKLYLSPEFVESESDFKRLKSTMVRVADVKTFKNFMVAVPDGVSIEDHNTVIVWCETFSEFITAAKYR
jgi:Electron transfer DM13